MISNLNSIASLISLYHVNVTYSQLLGIIRTQTSLGDHFSACGINFLKLITKIYLVSCYNTSMFASLHITFSSVLSLLSVPNFSVPLRKPVIGFRAHLHPGNNQDYLPLFSSLLNCPLSLRDTPLKILKLICFGHKKVPGVRMWTCHFGGHHSTHYNLHPSIHSVNQHLLMSLYTQVCDR